MSSFSRVGGHESALTAVTPKAVLGAHGGRRPEPSPNGAGSGTELANPSALAEKRDARLEFDSPTAPSSSPRVLICGDRNWSNRSLIESTILKLKPSLIIEGGANGADFHAREVAKHLAIPFLEFPANWAKYGRAAGPLRNEQMLKEGQPDLVVAFHNDLDSSKGTRNMVNLAFKAGVPVAVISEVKEKE